MNIRSFITSACASSAMGLALMAALPAFAQDAPAAQAALPDSAYDDIVVTAQKRNESAQDVPISLSAFNSEALASAGITSPGDLQRIAPTFKFTSSIGTLASRLSIRGIGTFGNSAIEPSVATFIDGIYIPRPASIINSLLDIQAVEVLSGPQGTLFGRNASVGALSFRTGAPSTAGVEGKLTGEYSTGERFRTEGFVNVPVNDKVAVRVAGLADLFGGYWKDTLTGDRFGGIDTYQGRVSIKTDLSDTVTWTVRGDYQQNKGDGLLNAQLVPDTLTPTTLANLTAAQGGIVPQLDLFSRSNNTDNTNAYVDDTIWGVSSDLSIETGGGYTIRLLNGYYDWNSNQGDGDTASLSVYALGRDLRYDSESQSHELQLISPTNEGMIDFVAGLYYFEEDLGILADSLNGPSFCDVVIPRIPAGAFPGLPGTNTAERIAACQTYTGPSSRGAFTQNTRSLAAYLQTTVHLTDQLDVTGGVRFTDEKKTGRYVGTVFNPTGAILAANEDTSLRLKDNRVTWRGNIAWRPTDDVMLFGTVSNGFKSGGFNNGIATANLGQQRIFNAETVTNYELGVKSQFFDRALTFNATVYRMDIGNFQERSIVNTTSTIRNVGKVRHQGVEMEAIVRPARNVRLNASVAYLDSDIRSYPNAPRPPYLPAITPNFQNLQGERLNYTPKWSGVVGAEVGGDVGASGFRWVLNGDVNFTSSQLMGTTIDNGPLTRQGGYALLNSRVTVYGPEDKWSLSVFGRNLADKGYCASKVYQVLEGPLGLRYDSDGVAGNDGTAVRCNVAAPRVIGVSGTINF